MEIAVLVVFLIGYVMIATEHSIKIDKAATALFTGVVTWALYMLGQSATPLVHLEGNLAHHVEEISSILLFLMGAMTIVEIVDAHDGFTIITNRITAKKKIHLLWILSFITFFLSAALDNLTTAIVMISLLKKLIHDQQTRWFFAGMVIVAANAGGAWSPIGDVTTTMLWIGGQITTRAIIVNTFLPSLLTLLVPLIALSFVLKGNIDKPGHSAGQTGVDDRERNIAFFLGVGGLLFVPVFKTITHLPPFMGIMFSLGLLWITTELIHGRKLDEEKHRLSALSALRKIDMPSVLFFLGILLAVAALGETGWLSKLSIALKDQLGNTFLINITIGLLSAVVDNVPLVAASMGMYPLSSGSLDPWLMQFAQDGEFWTFLAYCAGTGGSILIIGSAAGVAVMGLEKITFGWYLKKIAPWALLGYIAGCLSFVLLH